MHLNTLLVAFAALVSTSALPFNGGGKARGIEARTKTYAIVNVDGGSTSAPPTPTTVDQTTTVEVTTSPSTVTDKVTTTATPTPTTTSSSTPSIVTVIVTPSASSTQYYDNGLWHTSYAIKTFETVATTTSAPFR